MKLVLRLCIFFGILLIATTVQAQQLTTGDISFELSPENPQPLQEVRVRLQSYAADLDTAYISWRYNNRSIGAGIGEKEVIITTGPAGTKYTLEATVSSAAGRATASTTIQSSDIDIVWEALDAYVPPFYKGKALIAEGSRVRVTALSANPNSRNTVYTWLRNSSAEQSASGAGKNSFTFIHNEIIPTETISVAARGGTAITGNGTLYISPITPTAIAYERRGGFIDYANGFAQNFSLNHKGTILRIEPYFFSVPQLLENDLIFDFLLGGVSPELLSVNEIPLIRPETSGQATLSIAIKKVGSILQNINTKLLITF